ncbi:MAG: hypothetical protein ACI828_002853 [Flavobacteriales bacterium]|jgi:hypothetical protein
MSFGAGQHMGRSIQVNLRLKGKRKTFFDRTPEKINEDNRISTENMRVKMTLENLLIFRKKIQHKKKELRIKRIVFTALFMFASLLLLRYLNGGPL